MVKRIVGYDDSGKQVFDREAREYDKSMNQSTFGVTINDLIKAIPVIFLCGIVYAGQQSINANQVNINAQTQRLIDKNSEIISSMKDAINNLNMYLSSTTGKQFKDGRPL